MDLVNETDQPIVIPAGGAVSVKGDRETIKSTVSRRRVFRITETDY